MSFFGKAYNISSFEELMNLAPVLEEQTYKSQLVLIKGLGALEKDKLLEWSRRLNKKTTDMDKFISWDFGFVMELKEDLNPKNYLFSKEEVPYHWDGAFHEEAGVLIFNCIEGTAKNTGRTLFANTKKIISNMGAGDINYLETQLIEYKTKKLAHYGGRLERSPLDRHPITGEKVLRFGEEVKTSLNPVRRIINDERTRELINELEKELYKEENCYRHEWVAGDILLADNHSLLHGRESFAQSDNGERHIRRIQLR